MKKSYGFLNMFKEENKAEILHSVLNILFKYNEILKLGLS